MKQKGFTLIELLVVIAIIGILSSVVLASLNSARSKGRDANRVTALKQLQLSFELYFDSCGQYPATLATTANNGGTCSASGTSLGSFISTIPIDPSGSSYGYTSASPYTTYKLGATLENAGSPALATDIDTGTAGALSCADPVFCVQP